MFVWDSAVVEITLVASLYSYSKGRYIISLIPQVKKAVLIFELNMDKTKESDSKSISEQERREKVRQGLLLKKGCEAKALSIVEALLLESVEKEKFREAGMFLNEGYYNDLVDERSCSNLCGYALCNKTLENVAKQQYHISTKHNKVFDITERKKFCSNLCFKSSNFYKDQLLRSKDPQSKL